MRLAVLTTGRQDWGILRSTCVALREDPRFDLRLLVGGMHLEPAYGSTVDFVIGDGFQPHESLAWIAGRGGADDHTAAALSMIGPALRRQRADALLLVGDRSETAAAAIASTMSRVPIAHLHGGEETAGAFDDAMRNAITKLSHLHLVSHPDHALRVIAMGEAPDTVHVVGAPGLDNLYREDLPDRADLSADLGVELSTPSVVVTLQPTTLASERASRQELDAVIGAMERVSATYVVTLPNDDPGHEPIRSALIAVMTRTRGVAVEALGERRYWGLLRIADAMLGNSSSGLIEAPAVGLPVVNVGDRQAGRTRGSNVIDVPPDANAVVDALQRAIRPETRQALLPGSPYGDGHAWRRIVEVLAAWTPPSPPRKASIPVVRVSS